MTSLITTQESLAPTTQAWAIDPSHTQVGFAVKHLMISTVKGRFGEVTGELRVDETTGAREVSASIGVASISTGDERRDAHLRSADFFNADQYPQMEFSGHRIEGDPESNFTLHGDLTIRGTTRPVALSVTTEGRVRDPWGNDRMGFAATAKLNRRDFGLEWNAALETGGVVVGDDVKITIEAELVRQ